MTRLVVRDDPAQAAEAAAALLAEHVARRLDLVGAAHVALAGGATPRRVYEQLAATSADWSSVHLWLGDERLVAGDDPDANVRMIREALAGMSPAPVLHPVRTELPDDEACTDYAATLTALVPIGASGVPVLDVAFLGIGEDGHTASLFPDSPALRAGGACVLVRGAPKPPPRRISMTLGMLRAARDRVVLASGTGKARAVARALGDPTTAVPASLLPRARTTFVLDTAAASLIDHRSNDA